MSVLRPLRVLLLEDRSEDARLILHELRRAGSTLSCDRIRIGEAFRNLITNAVKYNDKPEKWIEIGYGTEPGAVPAGPAGDGILRQQSPTVF